MVIHILGTQSENNTKPKNLIFFSVMNTFLCVLNFSCPYYFCYFSLSCLVTMIIALKGWNTNRQQTMYDNRTLTQNSWSKHPGKPTYNLCSNLLRKIKICSVTSSFLFIYFIFCHLSHSDLPRKSNMPSKPITHDAPLLVTPPPVSSCQRPTIRAHLRLSLFSATKPFHSPACPWISAKSKWWWLAAPLL